MLLHNGTVTLNVGADLASCSRRTFRLDGPISFQPLAPLDHKGGSFLSDTVRDTARSLDPNGAPVYSPRGTGRMARPFSRRDTPGNPGMDEPRALSVHRSRGGVRGVSVVAIRILVLQVGHRREVYR